MNPGSGDLVEELSFTLEKAGEVSGVEASQWNKKSERKKYYKGANNLIEKILKRRLRCKN